MLLLPTGSALRLANGEGEKTAPVQTDGDDITVRTGAWPLQEEQRVPVMPSPGLGVLERLRAFRPRL